MRHALLLALVGAGVAAPALADPAVIEGVKISRDIDCSGQDVVIAGQGNVIGLSGACGDVKVMGADHKVTFQTAKSLQITSDSIEASGGTVAAVALDVSANKLKATVSSAEGPAEVRIFGANQTSELRFTSAANVTVGGYANALDWSLDGGAKPPSIRAQGVDLKINRR